MEKILIDLDKLSSEGINLNEYLTLIKIYELYNKSDIPFYTREEFIESLKRKKFIFVDEKGILNLSVTAKKLLKINSLDDDITEILEYFKEITGKTKISIESPSNRKYIRDRIKQGYEKEDLKKVINNKYIEWKDSNIMSKYIRIETLFNQEKFQKYVNELDVSDKKNVINDNFRKI